MAEWQLFEPGTVPEWTTPAWYAGRDAAHHLEEGPHQERLKLAAGYVHRAAVEMGVTTVVDLGAGDGGLLSLCPGIEAWGYDLQPTNVDHAVTVRNVDVQLGDVINDPIMWGDLAIATEMLEHLVDPHGFVRRIRRHAVDMVVASSPADETPEDHYGFHAWAWDFDGYAELFAQAGFRNVVAHERAGMFQVIWVTR